MSQAEAHFIKKNGSVCFNKNLYQANLEHEETVGPAHVLEKFRFVGHILLKPFLSKNGCNDFDKGLYSTVLDYEDNIVPSHMFKKFRLTVYFGVTTVLAYFI